MIVQLAHNAVNAKLLTEDKSLKYALSEMLSYHVSGYENADTFRKGIWDGKKSFFNYKLSTFPAGFVVMVKNQLERMGHTVSIIRNAVPEPLGVEEPVVDSFGRLPEYEYQYEAVRRLVQMKQMIARLATGGGKTFVAKLAMARIGRKCLFLTTRKTLMYQLKRNVEKTMHVKVGVIGDSEFDVQDFINVGMVQTIATRLRTRTVEEEVLRLAEIEKNKFTKLIDEKNKQLTKAVKNGSMTVIQKTQALSAFKQKLNTKVKSANSYRKTAIVNCRNMEKEKAYMEKILASFEFVIAEEAHESGGTDYFDVMSHCVNANYRLALTATPFMKEDEEANMRLMACSGPVGIEVGEKELIDKGILSKPYFMFIDNPRPANVYPTTVYTLAYDRGIVHNENRNNEIVKWASWGRDKGLPVLILVNRTEHGNILRDALINNGLKCSFIYGKDEEEVRQDNLQKLSTGEINVLIGTNILDVGVDVPSIGEVILAAGGKAEVQLRQRIGRGLRKKKTGKNVTYIVDFQDNFNQHLRKHAKTRQDIIKGTAGFVEGIVPTFMGL